MISLTPEQIHSLESWFLPERIGSLAGSHVVNTGNGTCLADRWPAPGAVLAETAGNYMLSGDASSLAPEDLRPHVRGFVETSDSFLPLLRGAFPELQVWQRIVFAQEEPPGAVVERDPSARRLVPSDESDLNRLSPDVAWISKTWGGPRGLASSGFGWGIWRSGRLGSVACSFFLGKAYEDIGVVTEPGFRGAGLSTICARALCSEIWARGHRPIWTTSPDNAASIRVAEKLGFTPKREYDLYVIGVETPRPAIPG